MKTIDSPCIHTAEFLAGKVSTSDANAADPSAGSEARRHLEHCPECAELARVSETLGQAMAARAQAATATASAIDASPGFESRMIAGATRRIAVRRRNRIAVTAASACAAVLLVAGAAVQFTGGVTSEQTPEQTPEQTIDNAVADNDPTAPDQLEPIADPTPELPSDVTDNATDDALEVATNDLTSNLVELGDPENQLAYQADWKAAGGNVEPSDIVAAGNRIGLDRKQTAELRRLVVELEKAETKTQTEIDRANAELRNLLGQSSPDADRVGTLIDRISGLEAQMRKRRVLTWLKARKLLTGVQRQALERLQNRRRHDPRRDRDRDRDRGEQRHADHDHEHDHGDDHKGHKHASDGHDHGDHDHGDHDHGDHDHGFDLNIEFDGDGIEIEFDDKELERVVEDALKQVEEQLEDMEIPDELPEGDHRGAGTGRARARAPAAQSVSGRAPPHSRRDEASAQGGDETGQESAQGGLSLP